MECTICDGALSEPDHDEWKIRTCSNCAHKFGEYAFDYQFMHEKVGYFDDEKYVAFRAKNRDFFEKYARRRFSDIEKLRLIKPGGSVLEIGCSTGEMLKILKDNSYQVVGHDEAGHAIEYARKTYNVNAFSNYSDFEDIKFDAVFAFHVIEHVADPLEFIKTITRQLQSEGILYLRMPHINSLSSKLFGKNWPGLSVEHIQFFGHKSVELLLEKSGFELLYFGTQSHIRFFLGAIRRIKNGGSRPAGREGAGGNSNPSNVSLMLMDKLAPFYLPVSAFEKPTSLGDELIVIARKSN